MNCKNNDGSELPAMFDKPSPSGNTYEITITPHDTLIITVRDGILKPVVTQIRTRGIMIKVTENGTRHYEIDWSINSINNH